MYQTLHLIYGTDPCLERCLKHNPTLLSWILIYFHINPLLRYLTCMVSSVTPWCQQTDSCVSWHQWSEAGQYCAVCRCDVAAWRDPCGLGRRAWPGHRAPSWVINHWDDRNTGLYIMTHTRTTHVHLNNQSYTTLHKHSISPCALHVNIM